MDNESYNLDNLLPYNDVYEIYKCPITKTKKCNYIKCSNYNKCELCKIDKQLNIRAGRILENNIKNGNNLKHISIGIGQGKTIEFYGLCNGKRKYSFTNVDDICESQFIMEI